MKPACLVLATAGCHEPDRTTEGGPQQPTRGCDANLYQLSAASPLPVPSSITLGAGTATTSCSSSFTWTRRRV